MDGVYHLATHGMCPIHVRANWDGHRDGLAATLKQKFPRWVGHFRGCSLCREHDQCRGRFGRHVGCRRDARQVQLTLVRRAVWNRDRLFDGSFPVLSNCKDFEMAGVVSLCLCHNGFCYPTRLARCSARHVRPFMAKGARCVAESCGDPRDHNQSLPVFLAGFRGSGGRQSDGSPNVATA